MLAAMDTAGQAGLVAVLRGGTWVNPERIRRVCVALCLCYVATWAYLLHGRGHLDPLGRAIGSDFAAFYAASAALREGEAVRLYSLESFRELTSPWTGGAPYPWYYPPSALFLFYPLSLTAYGTALAAWLLLGAAPLLAVVARIVPHPRALVLAALFPGVFVATTHGQGILLLAAGAGGALLLLDRSPFAAGLLLGAVASVKPHMVALVPVAFLAGRHGRALAGMGLASAAAAGAAGLAFGWEAWRAFASSGPIVRAMLERGAIEAFKFQSTFAAVKLAGGGTSIAYGVHAAAVAFAMVTVWRVWRRGASLEARAATLLLAGLLATPYAFDYDLVLLGVALAFLARRALRSAWMPWERSCVAVAWVLPLFARPLAQATHLILAPAILIALLTFSATQRRPCEPEEGVRGVISR